MKVGLVDLAARRRNLAGSSNAGSKHCRALELRLDRNRIHDEASIHDSVHSRDDYLAIIAHFHFDDAGYRRYKTAMYCYTQPRSLAQLPLGPAGFLRRHLDYSSYPPCVYRMSLSRRSVVRVADVFQIDHPRASDQLQQIVHGITARRGGKLVGKRLDREGMVDVGDRSQPSDSHVSCCRTI